ncbi:type II secretion system F family protein [Clostridium sp. 'deep sea']|uniref:type II secretion system F family protein n=1 Tax=Clostridium sp. 'deep sea' TaxID=2779445 RepID=UPI0018964821|nr:type II secretion system F family protein [Clostridium sp. 'deep sea']QOR35672.1 type II secretion system F family protein [Clostridium sp. 'deep sea']
MPTFRYRARNNLGDVDKGIVKATDSKTALILLREKGLFVTKIKQTKRNTLPSLKTDIVIGKPVSAREIAIWANQFSAMYSAGIPISYIVLTLSQQTANKPFKKVQMKVLDEINQGVKIADAMQKYPKYFPELMVNMFRVGEEAGVMEQALEQIVHFYSQEYQLHQKLRTAMYYPIIVLSMAIAVIWLLMTRMVPAFITAYDAVDGELPKVTQTLIKVSDFMINNSLLIILSLVTTVAVIIFWSKRKSGKRFFDKLKLKLPVFGQVTKLSSLARFCRVFSTLQHHGFDVISALTLVERSINNSILGEVIHKARQNASRGQRITLAFAESKYYPPLIVNMLRIGEESGSIDEMLAKAADMYEADVKNMSERLTKMLEPFISLILAFLVGGILIAIIVPMFNMYNMVG